jgi:hypothetical protein
LKDVLKEVEPPRRRVGSLRLVTYKRIGRVYSLEILRKIFEECKNAGKSEDAGQKLEGAEDK